MGLKLFFTLSNLAPINQSFLRITFEWGGIDKRDIPKIRKDISNLDQSKILIMLNYQQYPGDHEINKLYKKIEALETKRNRIKILSKKYGFYKLYKIEKRRGSSPGEAFTKINNEFKEIFGFVRFYSIKDFVEYYSNSLN